MVHTRNITASYGASAGREVPSPEPCKCRRAL